MGTGFGHKARVAAKGATYIDFDRASGVTGYTDAWKQFLEGDSIIFSVNANGTTPRAGATQRFAIVGDLSEDLNRLYLENDVGGAVDATLLTNITVNDYIFEGDNAGSSVQDPADSEYREISGLLAAVDDGTVVASYHNIPRSPGVNRLWQGIVIDSSASTLPFGSQMSEDLLVYADEVCGERGSGKITHLVMSRSANRGYWKSLKGDRFFQDPRGQYEGGKGPGLQILLSDRRVTLKVARKLPPQLAFGLQQDTWKRWGLGKFEWDDAPGSIWNRAVDATGRLDQFYAVGNLYEEVGCLAPRKNFRIDNLAATA